MRELTKWEKFKDLFMDRLAYIFVIFAFVVVGIPIVILMLVYIAFLLEILWVIHILEFFYGVSGVVYGYSFGVVFVLILFSILAYPFLKEIKNYKK